MQNTLNQILIVFFIFLLKTNLNAGTILKWYVYLSQTTIRKKEPEMIQPWHPQKLSPTLVDV